MTVDRSAPTAFAERALAARAASITPAAFLRRSFAAMAMLLAAALVPATAAPVAAARGASAPAGAASAITPGDLADPVREVSQYKVDLWQTEQGLPLNTVQALLQSRDGGLWIGTAGGLARFDGRRFISFDAARAPDVASQPVFALLEDRQGRLWIGHPGGVTVYAQGRFSAAISKAQAGGRRIWSLAEDKSGAIWAAGDGALVRWKDGAVKTFGAAARRARSGSRPPAPACSR